MKRVLSLSNKVVAGAVLLVILFTASSFTFRPAIDAQLVGDAPQKKEQKVKVIIKKDGKETKIDTVFNLPDEKMINFKVDSMLKSLNVTGIDSGKFDVFIHHPGKHMKYMNRGGGNFPGDEQFDILIQRGDSGSTKHQRKIVRMGDEGDVTSLSDLEDNEILPPPPPPPPCPPFMMNSQFGSGPFSFDANDESIISYDKKDIGKGLEKITIVRKKRPEPKKKEEINVEAEISADSKK